MKIIFVVLILFSLIGCTTTATPKTYALNIREEINNYRMIADIESIEFYVSTITKEKIIIGKIYQVYNKGTTAKCVKIKVKLSYNHFTLFFDKIVYPNQKAQLGREYVVNLNIPQLSQLQFEILAPADCK